MPILTEGSNERKVECCITLELVLVTAKLTKVADVLPKVLMFIALRSDISHNCLRTPSDTCCQKCQLLEKHSDVWQDWDGIAARFVVVVMDKPSTNYIQEL